MQQLIGHLDSGDVELVDVPRPRPARGELLVANEYSVVSAGTERMLVSFGAASLVGKARREPGRVRQVLDKARTDGVGPTVRAVQARLELPLPLGYSSCGVVLEVGEGVTGFAVGDRVATNGSHAEVGVVLARLAAKVPAGVSSREAAFTTIASVAMNALREAEVGVGSVVGVIGLGLVGQAAVQVAVAAGCRVIGFDRDGDRADSIEEGFDDAEMFMARVMSRTDDAGVDAILIATDGANRDTTQLAALATRPRGTVVLVGAGDPTLDRRAFYERELRFVVSHAYGAGRDEYEWESGQVEYPRHRVRWTAQRNFEAVLDLLDVGALSFEGIESSEVSIARAPSVYEDLRHGRGPVATLFSYGARIEAEDQVFVPQSRKRSGAGAAVIGAGNYATRVLIPALQANEANLVSIASRGGLSSVLAGRKFGFSAMTTNLERIWSDPSVEVVFIATPHETHVEIAEAALAAGKHVWLEKPMSITREGLSRLAQASAESDRLIMAAFNRRFAPTVVELSDQVRGRGPLSMVYTVNALSLPRDHWLNDPRRGGGRLVGEACHFVDLLRFLVGSPIVSSTALPVGDGATLSFGFEDGSVGTVHYFTSGHSSVPKERLEVFGAGRVWQLDNFRTVNEVGAFDPVGTLRRLGRSGQQDKGHDALVGAFLQAVRTGGDSPIPFAESLEVSHAIFDALQS